MGAAKVEARRGSRCYRTMLKPSPFGLPCGPNTLARTKSSRRSLPELCPISARRGALVISALWARSRAKTKRWPKRAMKRLIRFTDCRSRKPSLRRFRRRPSNVMPLLWWHLGDAGFRRRPGSLLTRRWREMDSNHQYRGTKARDFRRASRHDRGAGSLNRSHRSDQRSQAEGGRCEGENSLVSGRDADRANGASSCHRWRQMRRRGKMGPVDPSKRGL